MNFDPDPEDERFRIEIRTFLENTYQELFSHKFMDDVAATPFDKFDGQRWTQALDARGILVPHWPNEIPPVGWQPHWRGIVGEELGRVGGPGTDPIGIDFVGPMLNKFGSDEQKRRYIPGIRGGEQRWCQGYSEPGAGSDVMSLRTSAVRNRDKYVVNGHKLWTSNAHFSDMMFALVRIEIPGSRKQQGLSFLLIDMQSPGITVRPLYMIDGIRRVNEVLLEDVSVPVNNLVGEQGKGWVYGRYVLTNERTVIAGLGLVSAQLQKLKEVAVSKAQHMGLSQLDPLNASRIAQFEIELEALQFMELRGQCARGEDETLLQTLPPMLKLRGSQLRQKITALTLQMLGEEGLEAPSTLQVEDLTDPTVAMTKNPALDAVAINYLFERSGTIAGGTSEIQRNVIAGTALQL